MLVVHTADVHIGVENYGIPDPETRSSSRLKDFLNTLDEVVDYSITQDADLVLFAGDQYKSRNPSQTHQREFAYRISKLANSGIQVFLLAGNHDSPNIPGPATALDIFSALDVKNVHIANSLETHLIKTKSGPIQIVALPWIRKGQFMSSIDESDESLSNEDLKASIEEKITTAVKHLAKSLDPTIPSVLAGHVSVDSATTSSEKSMMLGKDYVLLKSAIALPELDYIALGHIHKHQILNTSPKIVYPGSLQRIDFGEEKDVKGFCAITLDTSQTLQNRETSFNFIPVNARKFVTIRIDINDSEHNPMDKIFRSIDTYEIENAIVQVFIETPANKSQDINETKIRSYLANAHFVATVRKNIITESRNRLGKSLSESIAPVEALSAYLDERQLPDEKKKILLERGKSLIEEIPPGTILKK